VSAFLEAKNMTDPAEPTEANKYVTRRMDGVAAQDRFQRGQYVTIFEGAALSKIKQDAVEATGQPLNTTANRDRVVYNAYVRHHTAPGDR
jgi:hydrogenase maturation factor